LTPNSFAVSSRITRAFRCAAILLATVCTIVASAPARAGGQDTIEIVTSTGVHVFSVELATNEIERSLGLMYRKELAPNHGMLFDFQQNQSVQFWMHNTYISLDMIFITADGRVLHVAENAKPMSDTLIPSGGAVRGVLEVIAGTVRKFGIKPGDLVTGSFFGRSR
jgi:uncharacterized protein